MRDRVLAFLPPTARVVTSCPPFALAKHRLPPSWPAMRPSPLLPFGRAVTRTALLWLAALLAPGMVAAQGRTGEQIYRQQCATCHGAAGEGTEDNYPRRLAGERS